MLETCDAIAGGFACDGAGVAEHAPVLRGHDRQLEGRLLVRLLEGGVHPAGISRLELGVQVHLAVGVDEAVQALTGVGEPADRIDHHCVPALAEVF